MRCLETTRAELGSGGPGGRRKQSTFLDPFDAATDTRLPGEQYSLNEQCELALGKGYRAYTSAKAPFQVSRNSREREKSKQTKIEI